MIMSMSIEVIRPGLLTTVQDLGRPGLQRFGVTPGGAMDTLAMRMANVLAGNNEREAVLEATMAGPSLAFERDTLLAIAGGDLSPAIDGEPAPMNRPLYVPAGRTLAFGRPRRGCRAYVAVSGGFDVPEAMGSRSTYLRGGLGGYEGRALQAGDRLAIRAPDDLGSRMAAHMSRELSASERPFLAATWSAVGLHPWERLVRAAGAEPIAAGRPGQGRSALAGASGSSHAATAIIRVLPATHEALFADESLNAIYGEAFAVAPQSDRMGYRLTGTPLRLRQPAELLSEAVAFGTVQVPPDGQPIVLMADRQTTGGYPRIAQVASVDLPLLAQLKPGDRVVFEAITASEAERLLLARERELARLRAGIRLKFR
ncbi:biotin-dependent carboxyltransferase family protein [Paenibacillus methanolicus]|uniref:Antagonist of KipI n=1 Tax=Paenibacillus methanolicus TaxID=582686 RepID=A0A5S5BWM2_9BACL|nr:biotin-dependent carboxyltransferase family protein [Paenibacillus methanolicus]TYP71404.1 antagonist of KipI [Paenibacillus methanolicus]